MEKKTIGVLAILGAGLMWSLEPVFAKLAYAQADFVQVSAMRAVFASLIALAYALACRGNFRVGGKKLGAVAYLAFAGTLVADLLYFFALTTVPVVNAVLIAHMQPVFVILIGFFMLKTEILTRYDYAGIILMILAGLMVTTATIDNLLGLRLGSAGDFYLLVATLAWSTTAMVAGRYLKGVNAGIIGFYRFLIASVALGAFLLLTSTAIVPGVFQILTGVVVGAGTVLYYEGLERIKVAQASALEISSVFFAAIIAFLVLGESTTLMQAGGIVVLFGGVYLLSKKEKDARPAGQIP